MVMLSTADLRALGIANGPAKKNFNHAMESLVANLAHNDAWFVPVEGAPENAPWEGGAVYHATFDWLLVEHPELAELEVRTSDALAMRCCTDRNRFARQYFPDRTTATVGEVWRVGRSDGNSGYVAKTLKYIVVRHMLATGMLEGVTAEVVRGLSENRWANEWTRAYNVIEDALNKLNRQRRDGVPEDAVSMTYRTLAQVYFYNRDEYDSLMAQQREYYRLRAEREAEARRLEEERAEARRRELEEARRIEAERQARITARRAPANAVIDAALLTIAATNAFDNYTLRVVREYLSNHISGDEVPNGIEGYQSLMRQNPLR